jgi:hypothetical protein
MMKKSGRHLLIGDKRKTIRLEGLLFNLLVGVAYDSSRGIGRIEFYHSNWSWTKEKRKASASCQQRISHLSIIKEEPR